MLYPNLNVNEAGHLTMAGYDTAELAKTYGTPLLVMDEARIRSQCRIYRQAMAEAFPAGSRPLFASKALSIRQMYRIMAQEQMEVDVSSAGELYTALKAGFPMEKVYYHGNNKSDADIRFAMENGLGWFICDNADELYAIQREAERQGIRQKILLRLTPGIDPHTNEKINTGRIDSKFGVPIETGQAQELTGRILELDHVRLEGFHCHVGSQVFDPAPLCDAAEIMVAYAASMQKTYGFRTKILNLGGGMAVPYRADDPAIDYAANIRRVGRVYADACRKFGLEPPKVLMEPGRSLVAAAGLTLYTVGSVKKIPDFKNFVSIDGGMTDNPRYTLYGSKYTVLAADRMNEKPDFRCTLAGRCCESGDLIQENVLLPEPKRGDLVSVLTTGAYNYSMASNYNRVPRPALVMLGADGPYEAVHRESLEDLLNWDL